MKKFYKILLLLIALVFFTTFNSKEQKSTLSNNNSFFSIKNIEIENNLLISENQLKEKLKNLYLKNIFFIRENDVKKYLKETYFLKEIQVKKKFPDTILIKVFETNPEAIILKNKIKYLIDSSSNLIPFENNKKFSNLPHVFGENAEKSFIIFLNKLKVNNFLYKKVKSFYFFKIGRWDLQLLDNKIIKFPYNNIDEAIINSIELLKRKDFNNYNIIDLRVDGKIIVE